MDKEKKITFIVYGQYLKNLPMWQGLKICVAVFALGLLINQNYTT